MEMTPDWRAADTVMRKSMDALAVFGNQRTAAMLYRCGLIAKEPNLPDTALELETWRAMEMAARAMFS